MVFAGRETWLWILVACRSAFVRQYIRRVTGHLGQKTKFADYQGLRALRRVKGSQMARERWSVMGCLFQPPPQGL